MGISKFYNEARNHFSTSLVLSAILLCCSIWGNLVLASPYPSAEPIKQDVYSPYVGRQYPDQVLFGDAHFHTNISFDAGLIGTNLDMDAGYRFARGERVLSNTGQPVQLIRPLDFLFITDHAEFAGLATMIQGSNPDLLADDWGRWAYEQFNSGLAGQQAVFANIIELSTVKGINPFSSDDTARSIWLDFVTKADLYNEPGRFSAMTGFEWTSSDRKSVV